MEGTGIERRKGLLGKVRCGFDTLFCFISDTYTCAHLTDRRRRQAILPPRRRWRTKLLQPFPTTSTSTMAENSINISRPYIPPPPSPSPSPNPTSPLLAPPSRPLEPPKRLHTTRYLDGLRSVAALVVLHSHFLTNWFSPLHCGYLSSPENNTTCNHPSCTSSTQSELPSLSSSSSPNLYYPRKPYHSSETERKRRYWRRYAAVFRRKIRLWCTSLSALPYEHF